jgi:dolichol-phosphate mannosyltransferase
MKKLLSIVIPVFNEEENILPLYEELIKILDTLNASYAFEVIFVNDGSKDQSWKKISTLIEKNSYIQGISFCRNLVIKRRSWQDMSRP